MSIGGNPKYSHTLQAYVWPNGNITPDEDIVNRREAPVEEFILAFTDYAEHSKRVLFYAVLGTGILMFLCGLGIGIVIGIDIGAKAGTTTTNYWSPLLRGYSNTEWCMRADRTIPEMAKAYAGGGYPPSVCKEKLQGDDRIGA